MNFVCNKNKTAIFNLQKMIGLIHLSLSSYTSAEVSFSLAAKDVIFRTTLQLGVCVVVLTLALREFFYT